MKGFLKKFIGIIIFIGIESYFYFKKQPKDLETFFIVWALIAIILLVFNIFSLNGTTVGFGGRANNYLYNFTKSSNKNGTDKKNSKVSGGIFDPKNIIYLLCAIANIAAYIIVIRKNYY